MRFRGARIDTVLYDDPPEKTLDEVRADQIAQVKADCQAYIQTRFTSSALGAPHVYDADKARDRENLLGALALALQFQATVNFSCTDPATGVKAQVPHTPDQMAQVFKDGAAWVESNTTQFYALMNRILAATGPDEAVAIVWRPPQ